MNNRILLGFILLLAIKATAGAEMYRCELSDGSVIYGDKRVNLSDECQLVTGDSAEEYLSIQKGTPRRPVPARPAVTVPERQDTDSGGEPPSQSWVARATTLVENYNDARKRRIRESYMINKLKAKQEMARINSEKQEMLSELQESTLSEQKRQKIRGILAEIPEDAP